MIKSAKYWRDRAEEMRVFSEYKCSAECKRLMLNDAIICEAIAKHYEDQIFNLAHSGCNVLNAVYGHHPVKLPLNARLITAASNFDEDIGGN